MPSASRYPPAGKDLWEQYFQVRMSYLHSRSIDHIRRYGMRVSGIEAIDRDLDKQQIVTELTIDAMFEKWRAGVTINVIKYDDTAIIYRIIHAHLIAWAEYLGTGINIGNAPLKDLIELDHFAEIVYDKAKSVFSKEMRETAIASNFLNVQSINFRNILTRDSNKTSAVRGTDGVEVTRITNNETVNIQDRHSLKELFSQQINQISNWRQT